MYMCKSIRKLVASTATSPWETIHITEEVYSEPLGPIAPPQSFETLKWNAGSACYKLEDR